MPFKKSVYYSNITYEVAYSWGYISLQEHLGTGLVSANISIEEEHQGKQLSRQLVRDLAYYTREEAGLVDTRFIYIDTDASAGFWDKMGFTTNPEVEDVNLPHYGYEKRIAWGQFKNFGNENDSTS
jgi:GNAT superfamily N-acetyltransferase